MGLPPDLTEAAAEAAPAAAPTVAEAVAAEVAADAAAPAPCGVPGVSPWLPLGACASQPCDLNLPLERTPLGVESGNRRQRSFSTFSWRVDRSETISQRLQLPFRFAACFDFVHLPPKVSVMGDYSAEWNRTSHLVYRKMWWTNERVACVHAVGLNWWKFFLKSPPTPSTSPPHPWKPPLEAAPGSHPYQSRRPHNRLQPFTTVYNQSYPRLPPARKARAEAKAHGHGPRTLGHLGHSQVF